LFYLNLYTRIHDCSIYKKRSNAVTASSMAAVTFYASQTGLAAISSRSFLDVVLAFYTESNIILYFYWLQK